MKHIYYFIGILFLIYELQWLFKPYELSVKTRKIISDSKKYRNTKFNETPKEYKNDLLNIAVPQFLYLIWLGVGLFTFNWLTFLFLLVFGFTIGRIQNLKNDIVWYSSVVWINTVVYIIGILFSIINSYHLKIDLFEYLIN